MIITLICLTLIVVGAVFVVIGKKKNDYYNDFGINFWGAILIVLGISGCLLTFGFIIGNATTCELNYESVLHEKEVLEYRIEHMEENITGNEMLYNDIVEFNNNLRNTKKWANSLWTNWFNNQYIASIDYIKLDIN